MPLTNPEPPDGIKDVLQDATSFLASLIDVDAADRLVDGYRSFYVGPIYNLTVVELLEGISLREGRLTGWLYLMPGAEQAVTAIEIGANAQGDFEPDSLQVHDGPLIESMAEVLSQLPKTTADEQFKLSLVRIPALRFFSAWLHNPSKAADVFLIFAPGPPGFSGKPYTEDEALELLRPLAESVAAQDPETDG